MTPAISHQSAWLWSKRHVCRHQDWFRLTSYVHLPCISLIALGRARSVSVMGCREERAEHVEALRELLDRLRSPDLTLGEAKYLRSQLIGLLERIERDSRSGKPVSAQTTGMPRPGLGLHGESPRP